jgi:hypothetical protein
MFSKISPKKYCKVCHDAGKSETEYTSHFIRENRDPCSKVVCPTLLSLECRYCSKKGHTVKYCKILEKDKILETRQSQRSITNTKSKSQEKYKQPNNMFSNLESDSEDEEQEVKEVEVRAPNKSYASALLRPAIIFKEVKIAPIITRQNNDIVPSYNNIKSTYIKNKSWADTDSDSDSELDEEKEEKEEVNDPNW